jgi:hypothetical protein
MAEREGCARTDHSGNEPRTRQSTLSARSCSLPLRRKCEILQVKVSGSLAAVSGHWLRDCGNSNETSAVAVPRSVALFGGTPARPQTRLLPDD